MESFDKISIRARMAYCINCIENYLDFKDQNRTGVIEEIIEFLWSFVESGKLDDWHAKSEEIEPTFILNGVLERDDFEFIDFSLASRLKDYYCKQDKNLLNLIEHTIWVGASNMYEKFNNSRSLVYLNKVIRIMNDENVKLPEIKHFTKSSVDLNHGWGNPVNRIFFEAD